MAVNRGIGSLAGADRASLELLSENNYRTAIGNALTGSTTPTPQSLMPKVPTLQQEFGERRDTYRGILGDPAEQRNLTQAQMLFDIANTALAFSTAGSRPGMSPAERLAEAAVETKLFPTIAARSQAAEEQKQKFDLAALQSAETSLAAKQKAASDYREALLKQGDDYLGYIWKVGDTTYGPFNMKSFSGRQDMAAIKAQYPEGSPFKVPEPPKPSTSTPKLFSLLNKDMDVVGQVFTDNPNFKDIVAQHKAKDPSNTLAEAVKAPSPDKPSAVTSIDIGLKKPVTITRANGSKATFGPGPTSVSEVDLVAIRNVDPNAVTTSSAAEKIISDPNKLESVALERDVVITLDDGKPLRINKGERKLPEDILRKVMDTDPNAVTTLGAFISEGDYFSKTGFTPDEVKGLSQADRRHIQGLPALELTDVEFEKLYKMPRASFEAMDLNDKKVFLGVPSALSPQDVFKKTGLTSVADYEKVYNSLDDQQRMRLVTGDLDLHNVNGQLLSVSPTGEVTPIAGSQNPEGYNTYEQLSYIIRPDNLSAYAQGEKAFEGLGTDQAQALDAQMKKMDAFITAYADDSVSVGGATVKRKLPTFVQEAIVARLEADENALSPVPIPTLTVLTEDGMIRLGARDTQDRDLISQEKIITGDFDLANSTGWVSGLRRLGNSAASILQEVGVGSGVMFKDTSAGDQQLQALANSAKTYLTSQRDRRILAQDLKEYESQIVRPSTFTSDQTAKDKLVVVRNMLKQQKDHIKRILANPGGYKDTSVDVARKAYFDAVNLIQEHDRAIALYQQALGETPAPASPSSQRAVIKSATDQLKAQGIIKDG